MWYWIIIGGIVVLVLFLIALAVYLTFEMDVDAF